MTSIENNNENESKSRKDTGDDKTKDEHNLVKASWALVIVTLLAVAATCYFMHRQVNEMKHATKLEWRPYLNIQMDSVRTKIVYDLSEGGENDTLIIRLLSEIDVEDDSFRAVNRLVVNSQIHFKYWNSGKNPLWFKIRKFGLISSTDWNNIYQKSSNALFQDILNSTNYDSLETDIVINPGETKNIDWLTVPDTAFFAKNEIDSIVESGQIVVYPYIFAEYDDPYKHKYNVLLIHFHQLTLTVIEKKLTPIHRHFMVEQYDWWDADN